LGTARQLLVQVKATPAANMSDSTKYMLVSLPSSISPTNDREEALTALRSTITTNNGVVIPFKIPEFKIGTLDALVQQADDLAKLETACQGVVAKVGDSLKSLLEGDEAKIAQQKTVNDSRLRDLAIGPSATTDYCQQSL
jgi:V-type H+-transporting ATPase subunit C